MVDTYGSTGDDKSLNDKEQEFYKSIIDEIIKKIDSITIPEHVYSISGGEQEFKNKVRHNLSSQIRGLFDVKYENRVQKELTKPEFIKNVLNRLSDKIIIDTQLISLLPPSARNCALKERDFFLNCVEPLISSLINDYKLKNKIR